MIRSPNEIRVAVNPSNLIRPVKINDRVFRKEWHLSEKEEVLDVFSFIKQEEEEIKRFLEKSAMKMSSLQEENNRRDFSYIKSLVPKQRVFSAVFGKSAKRDSGSINKY